MKTETVIVWCLEQWHICTFLLPLRNHTNCFHIWLLASCPALKTCSTILISKCSQAGVRFGFLKFLWLHCTVVRSSSQSQKEPIGNTLISEQMQPSKETHDDVRTLKATLVRWTVWWVQSLVKTSNEGILSGKLFVYDFSRNLDNQWKWFNFHLPREIRFVQMFLASEILWRV